MKILITGGAGFIGSHLAERLLNQQIEVVCIDNFNDFYNPAIKRNNIKKALEHPGYTLITGDILDKNLIRDAFQSPPDVVVHLAAYAGVRPSIERPHLYQQVNIEGTLNLLEQCKVSGVKKFVFASSSSVYGGNKTVPFKETHNILNPISPYAATKVAGEALCYTYHHLFNISVHMHRFFTVYGPRQRPEMAIHLFSKKIAQEQPITLFGDGQSSRDYTYIDDIISGLEASIQRCTGCDVFNLGGSQTTSLQNLVNLIGKRLNKTPKIISAKDQPGDVPITFADITKAQKLLDYRSQVPIEQGIDKFCTWLEANLTQ